MKNEKKDLLFADFNAEALTEFSAAQVAGGQGGTFDTDDACTSGDVGCCDTDTGYYIDNGPNESPSQID